MKRLVGIDYGMARIGIAVSDPGKIIASVRPHLLNKGKLEDVVKELIKILSEYQIEEFIVGMPYRLNGELGFSADEVNHFIKELEKQTDIPIKTFDERLTTVQMEREMKSNNMNRKKRVKVIDSACAALILQSYLNQFSNTLIPSYD